MVNSFSICRAFAFVCLFFAGDGLYATDAPNAARKNRIIEAIGERLDRHAFSFGRDFASWPEKVAAHREAIDQADSADAFAKATQGALSEFGISHVYLSSPEQSKRARKGEGLGIGIMSVRGEQGAFIAHVFDGSPAWKAGIRPGDTILEVDGKRIGDLVELKGKSGDKKRFKWVRKGDEMSAEVVYGAFDIYSEPTIDWIANERVAVIRIHSFMLRSYRMRRIDRFAREAKKAEAIIVDVRGNLGGLSYFARHLSRRFLRPDQPFLVRAKRKHYDEDEFGLSWEELQESEAEERGNTVNSGGFGFRLKQPVVVLVDRFTASGGELFAGALKDNDRAKVMGTKTAGALLNSLRYRLPYGYRIDLPFAEILTPRYGRLEGVGLIPDYELTQEETANSDLAYAKALEALGITPLEMENERL